MIKCLFFFFLKYYDINNINNIDWYAMKWKCLCMGLYVYLCLFRGHIVFFIATTLVAVIQHLQWVILILIWVKWNCVQFAESFHQSPEIIRSGSYVLINDIWHEWERLNHYDKKYLQKYWTNRNETCFLKHCYGFAASIEWSYTGYFFERQIHWYNPRQVFIT